MKSKNKTGIAGNYYDIENRDGYRISGVKKNLVFNCSFSNCDINFNEYKLRKDATKTAHTLNVVSYVN